MLLRFIYLLSTHHAILGVICHPLEIFAARGNLMIQFWTFLFALAFAAFLESSICFSLFSEDDSGVDVSEMLQVNVLLQRRLLMSKFSVSNVLQAFLYFHLHPLDCVFYFVPSSYSLFLAVRFVKSETMEAL